MTFHEGTESLVSIVTPAYNEETYIEENLKSVFRQDHPNIEHVVIDDGSTDDTPEILESYSNRSDLRIISQENEGLPNAVKTGFSRAAGDIVIWLNADDVLCKTNSASQVAKSMAEHGTTDVLYGPRLAIGPDNEILGIHVPDPRFSYDMLKKRMFTSFIVFDGEIINRHSLNTDYQYAPDYEFALRLAKNGAEFRYVGEPIFAHRIHPERITDQLTSEMRSEGKRCQREHGQEFNTMYRAYRKVDHVKTNVLRLFGLKHLYSIHNDRDRLAFDTELGSVSSSFKTQLNALYTPF